MPAGAFTFEKFTPERQTKYLATVREYGVLGLAARRAGVSTFMVREYKKAHPEFAQKVVEAHMDYSQMKLEPLLHRACEKLNITAIIFALTNYDPERFKDRRAVPVVNVDARQTKEDTEAIEADLRQWVADQRRNLPAPSRNGHANTR